MTTECYAVIIEGQKPRFYEKLSTAKSAAAWYRNHGAKWIKGPVDPVVKEFILLQTVEA